MAAIWPKRAAELLVVEAQGRRGPSCNHRLAFCVASGRSIFPGSLYPEDRGGNSGQYPPGAGPSNETIKCRVCRHRMYTSEVRKLRNCPLCHSRLDIPAPPPIHSLG
ncbi:hypothetical protein AK812_SmicGene15227 [Symbiodinium microadriaticum]|uniref:IFT121-like zinc finger domain-containing protein n=1 Tax=Symbiodinium microadriaticum TaxID=2951 RepID=A0A1Q9E3K0_SYMMI|nr:hypothetical protein AK812_SmicGene15227 [Symbiodinium microadriaticum]